VAYNKDIFTKLGLTIPKTLSDLLAMVPKIKAAGLQPMSLNAKDGWPNGDLWFSQLAYTDPNATLLRSAEAGKAPWNSPAFLTAANNVAKMQAAGLFSQNAASLDFTGAYTEFATGKSALLYPVGNFGTARDRQHLEGLDQLRALPLAARLGQRHAACNRRCRDHLVDPHEDQELGGRARPRAGVLGAVRHQDADRPELHPAYKTSVASNDSQIYKRMVSFQATAGTRSMFIPKINTALPQRDDGRHRRERVGADLVNALAAAAK